MRSIKHYESLVAYHNTLINESTSLGNTEGAMYHKGMRDAYQLVINTCVDCHKDQLNGESLDAVHEDY